MISIQNLTLCLFIVFFTIQTTVSLLTHTSFLKNKSIYSELNKRLSVEIKEPIILNSSKTTQKQEFCNFICTLNNLHFREYTFDDFMQELPHNNFKRSLIYVNDFLVGNGRILNSYEEEILKYLRSTSNLIVLNSENIDTIPFKDINIIRKFPIIQYPVLTKKDIVQYLYVITNFNKYNDKLYLINWKNYDVETLNFENLNILLYEINNLLNNGNNLYNIEPNINDMIKLLNVKC
jgi:hypothetical protein